MECPFCATEIPEAAVKCPHCREWLDAGAAERARPKPGVHWESDRLCIPRGGVVEAPQCLICGGPDGVKPWTKRFRYSDIILSHYGYVTIPRCSRCRRGMILTTTIGWLVGVIGFFAFPAAGVVLGETIDRRDGGPIGGAGGFFLWLGFLVCLAVWNAIRGISCKYIDDHWVKLKFPKPDVTRRVLPNA